MEILPNGQKLFMEEEFNIYKAHTKPNYTIS